MTAKKNLNDRGEYFNKLVARIVAVEFSKDAGNPKTAHESTAALKDAITQPGLMNAYQDDAVRKAEAFIFVIRSTKEGAFLQKTDEEIAKFIMESFNERK